MRILVVEDDEAIRNDVVQFLSGEGYEVEGRENGRTALKDLESGGFDLGILDGNLPGMDGFRVLEILRSQGISTPVIFLSARGTEADRLLGFHLGANDYLVKPFFMSELGARVRLLFNGQTKAPKKACNRLNSGTIHFDAFRLMAIQDGTPLDLLPKEAKLLEVFLRNPGRTLSREALVKLAWERDASPSLRTVDAHVARLRKKLGSSGDHLSTIPGEGYRWVMPVDEHPE